MQETKKQALEFRLKQLGSLAVAFSGGVDSTFLLAVAANVISGRDRLVAVTEISPLHPETDIAFARSFAANIGVRLITIDAEMMHNPDFIANPSNRCYLCKRAVFRKMMETAGTLGIQNVAHGVNLDDIADFRPGMVAARELSIHAPLLDAGFMKQDIRILSRDMDLPTWDKPSSGCLATRIPYGHRIDAQKLKEVAAAEAFIRNLKFSECRVRHYGELAKIEISIPDAERLREPGLRLRLVKAFREIGFLYISLDLEGFDSGRLNRSIQSHS